MKKSHDNHQRLVEAIARGLGVRPGNLHGKSSQENVKEWDSLGIVRVVAEVEAEFRVQFTLLEIAEFLNIELIQTILAEKGIKFAKPKTQKRRE